MSSHNKLIADVANKILGPLGFRRKGRSRIWLLDHGWWLTVAEFQPSSWAKGSGLNVAAHWLWIEQDHLSFDYLECSETFVEYGSDAQFEREVTRMVQSAAREASRLHQIFTTIEAAATELAAAERELPHEAQGSWAAYHAGMAMALSGRTDDAAVLLNSVRDERVRRALARVEEFLSDPVTLRRTVDKLISEHRSVLGLVPEP